ncbi:hypothetical protein D3C73_1404900 [compost metagenome]
MQALTGEQDAGLDQFFVVVAHRSQQLLARHLAGFGILAGLHNDHESHGGFSIGLRDLPLGRMTGFEIDSRHEKTDVSVPAFS